MLESYKLRMAAMGSYEGESRRRNSQKIMDVSWMRDAATKPVYVKWVNSGLPIVDDDDIPHSCIVDKACFICNLICFS